MIYSSLDSSHRDESNECKIVPIGAIFAELAIFAKFQVGSGRVKLSDPTRYFGSVRVGYPDHGSKFGALVKRVHELKVKKRYMIILILIKNVMMILMKSGKIGIAKLRMQWMMMILLMLMNMTKMTIQNLVLILI